MTDLPRNGNEPAPSTRRPILVSGSRAAVIANGSGDVSLLRETRGGPVEWGGVYAEGIRLTGPWWVRVIHPSVESMLGTSTRSISPTPSTLTSIHDLENVEIHQSIAAVEEAPGVAAVGRRLELRSHAPDPVRLRVETGFAPFLAPVLLEGIKPYEYEVSTRGPDLRVTSHGFGLLVHSDPLPSHLCLDRASWIGGRRQGELSELLLDYDLELAPGSATALNWIVAGGLERSLPSSTASAAAALAAAPEWAARAESREANWLKSTPELELPGLPEVEAGYRMARSALHRLYQSAEPDLQGLVAGYPWYSSFWGRDLAWMLPAVLWLGDSGRALASLRMIFRYQAKKDLPILGAVAGELPMQLTTGPIFLFGTSDTTLYYPDLVCRLLDHTGDPGALSEFGEPLEKIAAWALAKTDAASGLLRNGGEVAEIRSASDDAGSVHFSFDAKDTTIWDSTDRRDHAIDVQVLAVGMWGSLARLAPLLRWDDRQAGFTERSNALAATLPRRYAWPEEEYFADSLTLAGEAVARLRPNALRLVSAGVVTGDAARRAVHRVARDDLTTSWGVRTLSSRDPGFDPSAYHDGQVWPIATAWAADAALAAGEIALGLDYLGTLARTLISEEGLANECYRGDRAEPFDSCFLLGFSVAPFLSILFERLWGIRPRLLEGVVKVEPGLPSDGPPARLTNLALGPGHLDLTYASGRLSATWHGPGTLRVERGGSSVQLADGQTGVLDAPSAKPS